MKSANKLIAAGAVALALVMPASAQGDLSPQGILATGKMAGACGILDSMIQFQKSTRMEGGEAFVLRFWGVEAARLGMSVQQLSEQCNQSVSAYDTLWSAAETMP
jgi:hypothetical protein